MAGEIAIILIRSTIGTKPDVRRTLRQLGLVSKNSCVIVKDDPVSRGMLKIVKDYVTYGNIDEQTKSNLIEKKGEQKVFRLAPPIRGFGGIKRPFSMRGGLGDRKEKICDLIQRMI